MLLADTALLSTAAILGIVHTILGPDHYVPFVAMGRARGWSLGRTLGITAVNDAPEADISVSGYNAAEGEWMVEAVLFRASRGGPSCRNAASTSSGALARSW